MKKISIITCVYNEEHTVEEVCSVIRNLFTGMKDYEYEHLFMDNCSSDNTLSILRARAVKDKHIKVVAYSKNFGPVKTEYVGYCHASGDAAILFDANLKDPPEMIVEFIKKWEEGYDVVYGVRHKTGDNFLLAFARRLFYKICDSISEEELPQNAGGFRLLDKKVITEIKKIDDYKPYMRGIITSIGFKQIGLPYARRERKRGKSKSRFGYLVDFAINGFISYSILPIRFCTYLGVFLSMGSLLAAVCYFLIKIFYWDIQAPGIATVVVLLLFFSGIQLFFLGVIGEYVGAIHAQVRKKPFVVIKEKINFE